MHNDRQPSRRGRSATKTAKATEQVPRTAAATAARIRQGDEKAAERLRAHGWLVISPEHAGYWQQLNPYPDDSL